MRAFAFRSLTGREVAVEFDEQGDARLAVDGEFYGMVLFVPGVGRCRRRNAALAAARRIALDLGHSARVRRNRAERAAGKGGAE